MGHSAAWDHQWDKAIAAYGRAVQEFPDDAAAHNSLGLALLQARRLEDALKVYTRAHQLAPEDPIPLEKSADVLERLGRMKEAAQQYINVAEVYLAQRDLEKAIANWERATHLTSGLANIHQRLAMAYERTGQKSKSINQYLRLAFDFQSAGRIDIATQAVERALRIDPKNSSAMNTLQALKTGAPISPDLIDESEVEEEPKRSRGFEAGQNDLELLDDRDDAETNPWGPIGEAVENAMAALAGYVFDADMSEPGVLHAVQGIEYHRQDLAAEALGAYERAAAARMDHPALHFNLGVLLLGMERWKEAARHLELTTDDPDLAAGAMHGLSQIYNALGNPRAAAFHLVQALRLVDIGMTASDEEAEQLSDIYDKLTASIDQADEQQLRNMNNRFLELLTGPEWKQRVTKTRRQLEEAITLQDPESLISIVPYINDSITEGLNLIDAYMRNGLYNLAMDQAHYMLESAPDYLPLHWRIGQIMLERDNIQAAINKYNLVAKTYLVRGDNERATEILQEALKVAPMDTSLHQSLIEVLQDLGQWDQVLNQYIDLADAYYQLADTDAARATYQSAIQLAQRIDTPKDQIVHILHRMGDIDISRLDLRGAMRTYEQIRKLDAEDEQARRALVDLHYRLNDPISAIHELDGLLRVYAKQHRANRIIQVLEEEVTRYPGDMALRSRLAAVYRQTDNINKAVDQLDSLAELQLEAGLHGDALVTIRRIISMNPDRVEDYRRLLQQLSG
jgi:tetratricopeptide (TPR) repeat protein